MLAISIGSDNENMFCTVNLENYKEEDPCGTLQRKVFDEN